MAALPDKWLAFRLSAMGDVALTTGVLSWWKRTRGWTFAACTRAPWAPLYAGHPAVTEVRALGSGELRGPAWLATARKLARDYRGWGLMDLHGTLRSRVLAALWHGPVRRYPKFSLDRRRYLRWGSQAARERLLALNVPQRYALAVDALPPPRPELLPVAHLTEAEHEAARDLLAPLNAQNRPLVALHPYATHPDKAWPEDKWPRLARAVEAAGMAWFAIGRGEALPGLDSAPNNLVNATDLRTTCALLAQAQALVTGDSGPMHLAVAARTPVVALFGPTDQAWGFFPAGERDVVVRRDMECRPCSLHGKRPCPRGRQCLRDIAVDEVVQALYGIIDVRMGDAATRQGPDGGATP